MKIKLQGKEILNYSREDNQDHTIYEEDLEQESQEIIRKLCQAPRYLKNELSFLLTKELDTKK